MRELTFEGFLTRYVRSLSFADTNNVRKLTEEAAKKNPRLREPLLLYALFSGKDALFCRAVSQVGLEAFYGELLEKSREQIEAALWKRGQLPEGYEKVWRSFQSRKNRKAVDNETKSLMRDQILRLQAEHQVTNYRIYTDLKLNPGNMNAWLKYGEHEKVSLDTARRALQYLKTQCAS